MSESETPQPPAANPPAPEPVPAGPEATPSPKPQGDRGERPFRPRGDRPQARSPRGFEKPPVLDDLSNRGPNIRDLNAQIEDDLNAVLAGFSAEAMLASADKPGPKSAGGPQARKKGRVIAIHGEDVFVDVPGGRSQGVLSLLQFDGIPPAIGTEVEVDIEGYDGANGLLLLTRLGAVQVVDWSSVSVGMVVEAKVTATNKGGLSVEVNGIRGFMPISQVDLFRIENPEQFVNQKLRCAVTEVNPAEKNLVVSRRYLLEQEREKDRESFWAGLAVGQTRTGTVRSIREFGAFVDLGGADGMIPVSEMAWARVEKPQDIVKEGQTVEVKVIRLDPVTRKIALSMKALAVSPWDTLETRIMIGSTITGKVTRTAEFGAFVEVEPGIDGLVHISELAPHRVSRAESVVKVGQDVTVKVLNIDKESRRISLSLKAAHAKMEEPKPADDGSAEPEVAVKPRVRRTDLRGGTGSNLPLWRLPEEEVPADQ